MKRLIFIFLIFPLIVACQPNSAWFNSYPSGLQPTVINLGAQKINSGDIIWITGNQITNYGDGDILDRGTIIALKTGTSNDPFDYNYITQSYYGTGVDSTIYYVGHDDLAENSTYVCRAYAKNTFGTGYSDVFSFTTGEAVPLDVPLVQTVSPYGITENSASSGGVILDNGGTYIASKGVRYGTNSSLSSNYSTTADGEGNSSFSSILFGLSENTTYYVQAYANNSSGIGLGTIQSFSTSTIGTSTPTVTTNSVNNITASGAIISSTVTSSGSTPVTQRGINYSLYSDFSVLISSIDGSGTGLFTSYLYGLSENTTYYVRSYAINSVGTAYGNIISFTTASPMTAVLSSQLLSQNSSTTTIYWIITLSDATTSELYFPITVINVDNTGTTTLYICFKIGQQQSDVDYTYNRKATDFTANANFGTLPSAYSGNNTATYLIPAYTAPSCNLAVLGTGTISGIGTTSVTGNGSVTSDGGCPVTARGFVWGYTSYPTIESHAGITTDGSGTGPFTSSLTDLAIAYPYYAREYATNSVGTSYGNTVSFSTNCNNPTVTTLNVQATGVTFTTAYGQVNSEGGYNCPVTAKGFVWNTTGSPTISSNDGKTTDGSGSENYNSQITGLNCGVTYYIKAYATNSTGTAYGSQLTFTTGTTNYNIINLAYTITSITCGTFTGSITGSLSDVQSACQQFQNNCVSNFSEYVLKVQNVSIGKQVYNYGGCSTVTYTGYFINNANTSGRQIVHLTSGIIDGITSCP